MRIEEIRAHYAYNEWANASMVEAIRGLDEDQVSRQIRSSFPSIRDTFAHIVLGEWVWLRRWRGENPSGPPDWISEPSFDLLPAQLAEIESERSTFLASLVDEDLDRPVSYRLMNGDQGKDLLVELLLHVVNHSSYHRGQLATLLRQVGATPPATDLVLYLRHHAS